MSNTLFDKQILKVFKRIKKIIMRPTFVLFLYALNCAKCLNSNKMDLVTDMEKREPNIVIKLKFGATNDEENLLSNLNLKLILSDDDWDRQIKMSNVIKQAIPFMNKMLTPVVKKDKHGNKKESILFGIPVNEDSENELFEKNNNFIQENKIIDVKKMYNSLDYLDDDEIEVTNKKIKIKVKSNIIWEMDEEESSKGVKESYKDESGLFNHEDFYKYKEYDD